MGIRALCDGRVRDVGRGPLGVLAAVSSVVLFHAAGAPARAGTLNIIPTFDKSITGDANAAAIEATINSAVAYYNANVTTALAGPLNVTIYYQEGGGLGASNWGAYKLGWSGYIAALTAASSGDATDTTALAHLPTGSTNPVTGTTNVIVHTANARALGYNTPGFVGPGGTYDGVVTLNTSLTTPGSPGSTLQYSLFAVTEHETDEILGFGSDVGGTGFFASDPQPQDLFRYDSTGVRNYTTGGDNAYFSLEGTTDLVQFNQHDKGSDYADWWSHNGGGNPGPTPPPRVQDAYAFGGTTPTLATDAGQVELVTLDAIGYNLSPGAMGAVPEPATLSLLGTGMLVLSGCRWLRRKRRSGAVVVPSMP